VVARRVTVRDQGDAGQRESCLVMSWLMKRHSHVEEELTRAIFEGKKKLFLYNC
jgi:hypothetical protein